MTDTQLDIGVLGYRFMRYHLFPGRPSSRARGARCGRAPGKNVGEKGRSLTLFASGTNTEARQ